MKKNDFHQKVILENHNSNKNMSNEPKRKSLTYKLLHYQSLPQEQVHPLQAPPSHQPLLHHPPPPNYQSPLKFQSSRLQQDQAWNNTDNIQKNKLQPFVSNLNSTLMSAHQKEIRSISFQRIINEAGFTFAFLKQDPNQKYFKVEKNTGIIKTTSNKLDREEICAGLVSFAFICYIKISNF